METHTAVHATTFRRLAETLDAIANLRCCQMGEVLFRQGDPAAGILVLSQGRVRLSASSGHGDTLSYRTVGPGYVLGLPALFSGRPYSLTAEALEGCIFGFVDRERALQLIRSRLDLCSQAAELLANELRELREWQAAISRCSPVAN